VSACVLALTAAASSGTACRKPLPGNESALQARMDSEQNTRIRMHTHITDLEWCHLNKDGKDDSEHSPQCLLLGAAWEMYGIQRSQGCQKVTVWNEVAWISKLSHLLSAREHACPMYTRTHPNTFKTSLVTCHHREGPSQMETHPPESHWVKQPSVRCSDDCANGPQA
jgi:hypothetical protein